MEEVAHETTEKVNAVGLAQANEKLKEVQEENEKLNSQIKDLYNELGQVRRSSLSDEQKEKLLKESLLEHEKKWKAQEEEKLAKIQNEFKTIEKQLETKDQELLQYEQSMMKLTEELSQLKDRMSEMETDDASKSQKLQEL